MIHAFVRRLRRRGERGVTIAEFAIAMGIFSIIGVMALNGLGSSSRSLGQVDDEVQGLQDLRTVGERVVRDLRQARGIDATSNANQVTIWIDSNADYKQAAAETITWKLVKPNPTATQYDILRTDAAGGRSVVGHTLVSDIAFFYDTAPPKTRVVTVEMTYDALPFRYASQRVTRFQARLRNVQ